MFKFLKHKRGDTWVDTAIITAIRFMIAGFTMILGYLLAFAATMGPPIAPHIWNGGLDKTIRISTIVIGFGSCTAVLIWFFWPLCRYVYRLIVRTK